MLRILSAAVAASLSSSLAYAGPPERPKDYDEIIARQAEMHGVPETLVHRIVMRESRYHPGLVHNHCFGLMQIKHATARAMGYKGAASGLLDPHVNLTYAVPYLANAYRLADGDENRATALFSAGYYYVAKRKKMLGALRTASSAPLAPEPALAPEAPQSPAAGLFSFLAGQTSQPSPPAETLQVAKTAQ